MEEPRTGDVSITPSRRPLSASALMATLITGARGLIGSALVDRLRGTGEQLICQSRNRQPTGDGVLWIQHDLVTAHWEPLSLPRIDTVYHLAGQTSARVAKEDPVADLLVNAVGFLRLLEFLRQQHPDAFVVLAGTVTEAGMPESLPMDESALDRPITFYDISKLTAEHYLTQFVREGFLRGCTLRLANVYGRPDTDARPDRGILDRVYKRALGGEKIVVFGDGNNLRDYIFIDDVVSAFVLAAKHADRTSGQSFCLGTGEGITIRDAFTQVGRMAAAISKRPFQIEHIPSPAGLETIELRNAVINSTSFRAATGWEPKHDFASGTAAAYGASANAEA